MQKNNNTNKAYINLSFPFIYSKDTLKNIKLEDNKKKNNKIPENLLSYVDRLYGNNAIYEYCDINFLFLLVEESKKKTSLYTLEVENININFFKEEIAFLNLELIFEYSSLEELYKVNKYITSIYSKKDKDVFVYFSKNKKIPLSIYAEDIGEIEKLFSKEDFEKIKKIINPESKVNEITISNVKLRYIDKTYKIMISEIKSEENNLYIEILYKLASIYDPHKNKENNANSKNNRNFFT